MNKTPDLPTQHLVTGIYWRKNLWNGAATVPVVFSLKNDVLQAKTKKEVLFEVPVSDISTSFSMWGTMSIFIGDKKYDFTGVGSGISGAFSAEQQKEIESSATNIPTNAVKAGAAGAIGGSVLQNVADAGAAGGVAQAAGVAGMTAGYFMGLDAIQKWQTVFTQVGVVSDKKTKNFKRSTALILGAIIVGVFIVVMVASLLTNK